MTIDTTINPLIRTLFIVDIPNSPQEKVFNMVPVLPPLPTQATSSENNKVVGEKAIMKLREL